MTRAIIQELLLFSPALRCSSRIFLVIAAPQSAGMVFVEQAHLLARHRGPWYRSSSRCSPRAFCAERQTGAFVPTHMENGRRRPGAVPVTIAARPRVASRPVEAPALCGACSTLLNGDGEETRIVGGAVRNALLGRPGRPKSISPPRRRRTSSSARGNGRASSPFPTGIEHGTITVIVDGEPFEVTTLREDVETDGRYAVVHFGRDFAADAQRRDFTINALSLSLDGQLHDYTGGVADLAARRVRFIGNAQTRIREDYLRILRFFRFHAEYGRMPIPTPRDLPPRAPSGPVLRSCRGNASVTN